MTDPNKRGVAHKHLGHWEETATGHYNLERQKAENAALTSVMIEQLTEGVGAASSSSNSQIAQPTSSQAAIDYHYESSDESSTAVSGEDQESETPCSESNSEPEEITEQAVLNFIKTRKQRLSQQRYQLSDSDYDLIAKLFFQFRSKDGNFSQLFRDSGLPMNLDAIKSIYKVVEKHFY